MALFDSATDAGMSSEDCDAAWSVLCPETIEDYYRSRSKGTSHNLAVIFASRAAPVMDRADERLRRPNEEARARGIKSGSYHPGLAQFPNDPRAVVQSRGDARRHYDKEGLKVGGDLPEHNTGTSSNQYKRAQAREGV